jgi:hypothetical protein
LPINPKHSCNNSRSADDKYAEYSCDGEYADVFSVGRCRRSADA